MAVRIEGVGVLVCDDGHAEVADDDLAGHLLTAMDGQLLTARSRPLRHDDACGDCGGLLTMPGRSTQTPVVDAAGPTVVTMTPSLPMVRCPDCGREQVPSAVGRALVDLVLVVVDAVGGTGRT